MHSPTHAITGRTVRKVGNTISGIGNEEFKRQRRRGDGLQVRDSTSATQRDPESIFYSHRIWDWVVDRSVQLPA
jgi:hypothetical protein